MQVGVNNTKKIRHHGKCLKVLEKRYLTKDEKRKVIETPEGMCRRVARYIASADGLYGATEEEIKELEKKFYDAMF